MPPKFRVYYKYSACVLVSTSDVDILCDPWFSDQAYYGAWSQYPPQNLTRSFIGNFDCIYLSHIHPDHYCPYTLKSLFELYGARPIYIADTKGINYLQRKLHADGFGQHVRTVRSIVFGSTRVDLIPVDTGSASDIDSALLVSLPKQKIAFLNANDCEITPLLANRFNRLLDELDLEVSLFALGYTGAGPYPQTYYPLSDKKNLQQLSNQKKKDFFDRYLTAISLIPSRHRLPFAGKYVLNGPSSKLNPYRGVADATEVLQIDPEAVVIADGGQHYFDLIGNVASSVRCEPYDLPIFIEKTRPYLWDSLVPFSLSTTRLRKLINLALETASLKSECENDCIWDVYIIDDNIDLSELSSSPESNQLTDKLISFNCNRKSSPTNIPPDPFVRASLFIHKKPLTAALLGLTHWNNYDIASIFHVRRTPDIFVHSMYTFLNFLHV